MFFAALPPEIPIPAQVQLFNATETIAQSTTGPLGPITPTPTTITPSTTIDPLPTIDPKLDNIDPRNKPASSLGVGRLDIKPFCGLSDVGFSAVEDKFKSDFEKYAGSPTSTPSSTADGACQLLAEVEHATGIRPALIYVSFAPPSLSSSLTQPQLPSTPQATDQLELIVLTPKGDPFRKRIRVTRSQVLQVAQQFRSEVSNVQSENYLEPAQQLYQWLIAPLKSELQARQIENLVFLMDSGLRSIPIAALHNGQSFLVEEFSVGLMPSISLTDTRYRGVQDAEVLAMGASQFRDQQPLPAVPLELEMITQKLRQGKAFLNSKFTPSNLVGERRRSPLRIVHLATHSEFRSGSPDNSYIQFWDRKVRLSEMRELALNNPSVDLLVLSACRTALGDEQAELGFAGLAIQAGVKTAMASLWYVSDEGTLGLMAEFYDHLSTSPIKAEGLRQAQISMLQGKVRIAQGQLISDTEAGTLPLPAGLKNLENTTLSHPYYWAGFTLIGNPW